MDNETKGLIGIWIEAIGQTMSAVAVTPFIIKDEDLASSLDLWGNVLQGTGTALIADSEKEFTLEKLGSQVEAIGNLVAIMSYIAPVSDETKETLDKQGDIIQALGVGISFPAEIEDGFTLESLFDVYGNFLQAIEIKGVDETLKAMIAEWSQAMASILALIHVVSEESDNH